MSKKNGPPRPRAWSLRQAALVPRSAAVTVHVQHARVVRYSATAASSEKSANAAIVQGSLSDTMGGVGSGSGAVVFPIEAGE